MKKTTIFAILLTVFFLTNCKADQADKSIVWDINNTECIGGHKTTAIGSPKVIVTEKGKAVEFDGIDDILIVDALGLTGAEKFTVEVIIRPDPNSYESEQKFLHVQENDTKNRIILLTGKAREDLWYFDSFVKTSKDAQNLWDSKKTHPTGRWYNVTIVCNGKRLGQYVNGSLELSGKLEVAPYGKGKVSIGAKLNKKSFFKGAIRKIRFTPRALKPREFLKP